MAKVIGEVGRLNKFDTIFHASNAMVLVIQDRKPLAFGEVDRDERFEIELPKGTTGEIEIRLGLHGAAPVIATATGDDIAVTVFYNNSKHYG